MVGETEVVSGKGVLRQDRDTDSRYCRCQSMRDTDAEESSAERAGC
jgi:hypothetical protein